jgi:hypothetical protein
MANPVPCYSHGGSSVPGFPAVLGTTTNSGRPVQILQAQQQPAMQVFWSGTSVTVVIEGNGGALDSTGNPPSGEWIDYSSGGYALTNGQNLSKKLPYSVPYWRTRITAINTPTGSGLVSYIPSIIAPNGEVVATGYPELTSGPQSYK